MGGTEWTFAFYDLRGLEACSSSVLLVPGGPLTPRVLCAGPRPRPDGTGLGWGAGRRVTVHRTQTRCGGHRREPWSATAPLCAYLPAERHLDKVVVRIKLLQGHACVPRTVPGTGKVHQGPWLSLSARHSVGCLPRPQLWILLTARRLLTAFCPWPLCSSFQLHRALLPHGSRCPLSSLPQPWGLCPQGTSFCKMCHLEGVEVAAGEFLFLKALEGRSQADGGCPEGRGHPGVSRAWVMNA